MQTAAQQRALSAVAGPRDESAPALMKAVREQKRSAAQSDAQAMLATLEKEYARALAEVQELDALWSLAAAPVVARLAQLQIRLAYLGHWIGDLREALLELSL